MAIKLIIFDLFGVIINSNFGNLEENLKRNNVKISSNLFNKNFKEVFQLNHFNNIEDGIDLLLQKIGEENNLSLKQEQIEFFKYLKDKLVVREEVVLLLKFLKKMGFKLAILSNSFQIDLKILRDLNLDLFDQIFLSCDTKILKPDLNAFKKVCNFFNLRPQECLMVGDSYEKDLEPAEKLGMKTILFSDLKV